jgi:hypothetical protein
MERELEALRRKDRRNLSPKLKSQKLDYLVWDTRIFGFLRVDRV